MQPNAKLMHDMLSRPCCRLKTWMNSKCPMMIIMNRFVELKSQDSGLRLAILHRRNQCRPVCLTPQKTFRTLNTAPCLTVSISVYKLMLVSTGIVQWRKWREWNFYCVHNKLKPPRHTIFRIIMLGAPQWALLLGTSEWRGKKIVVVVFGARIKKSRDSAHCVANQTGTYAFEWIGLFL